eukprot:3848472-Pyramimonas_sp.AAC.1
MRWWTALLKTLRPKKGPVDPELPEQLADSLWLHEGVMWDWLSVERRDKHAFPVKQGMFFKARLTRPKVDSKNDLAFCPGPQLHGDFSGSQ